MPLAINNGISLNPQPAAADSIAADSIVADSIVQNRIVNIKHRFQKGRLWCWAACIQMVLELNGTEMSQCAIVKRKLRNPNHPCGPNFQSRNESCDPEDMEQAWNDCGIQAEPKNGAIDMATIKEEIAANRPVEAGIIWHLGGGHAVLIKGWAKTSPETLLIDDPLRDSLLEPDADGSGRATRAELVAAFGHGRWGLTWKNLQ